MRRRRVTRGDETINLSPLSYELLLTLLRSAPDLVSLDELMQRVWPGLVVSPETVSQRVKLVRHALGDRAGSPRYIAGVRGRGYQLIADVEPLPAANAPHLNGAAAPAPVAASSESAAPATRPEQAADAPAARQPVPKRRLARRVLYATLALLAAVLLYPTGNESPRNGWLTRPPASGPELAGNSLAVLPFVNLSGDPASESFSEGLSEEILNRLSRERGVRVAARTSSFAYKDSDIDALALQDLLDVRYLLEGSVRREGRHLRVTAQLVDESGFRVWSATYDRKITGILAIQDEIAGSVVTSVLPRVTVDDDTPPDIEPT